MSWDERTIAGRTRHWARLSFTANLVPTRSWDAVFFDSIARLGDKVDNPTSLDGYRIGDVTTNKAIYLPFADPKFTEDVNVIGRNTANTTMIAEYSSGDGWESFGSINDGTLSGRASLGQDGTITFSPIKPVISTSYAGRNVRVGFTDVPTSVLGHQVRYRVKGTSAWTTTTNTLLPLKQVTIYDIQGRSRNAAGYSVWSDTLTLRVLYVPVAVTNLKAVTGNRTITLTWTAPPGATSYRIRSKRSSISYWVGYQTVEENKFHVTGLTNDVPVDFSVQAVNATGSSVWSPTVSATPTFPEGVPDGPVLTVVFVGDGTTANASWTTPNDNGSPITGYTLQYRRGNTSFQSINAGLVNARSVGGFTVGQSNVFRVLARNSKGDGAWSNEVTLTAQAAAVPPATSPQNIRLLPRGTTIQGTWDAVTGAAGYYVDSRPRGSLVEYSRITVNTNSVTIPSLSVGGTYDVVITPFNAGGAGPSSDVIKVTLDVGVRTWSDTATSFPVSALSGSLEYRDVDGEQARFNPTSIRVDETGIYLHGSHTAGYIPTSESPATIEFSGGLKLTLDFNDAYIDDTYGKDQVYVWDRPVSVNASFVATITLPTWESGTAIWETPRLLWEGIAQPPSPNNDDNVDVRLESLLTEQTNAPHQVIISNGNRSVGLFDSLETNRPLFINQYYRDVNETGAVVHEDSLRSFLQNLRHLMYGYIFEDKRGAVNAATLSVAKAAEASHDVSKPVRIDADREQRRNPLLVRNVANVESHAVIRQARTVQANIRGSIPADGQQYTFTARTSDDQALFVDWDRNLPNLAPTVIEEIIEANAESITVGLTNNGQSQLNDFNLAVGGWSWRVANTERRDIVDVASVNAGFNERPFPDTKWLAWPSPNEFVNIETWLATQGSAPELTTMTLYDWQKDGERLRKVQNTDAGVIITHDGKKMLVIGVELELDFRRSPRRHIAAVTL